MQSIIESRNYLKGLQWVPAIVPGDDRLKDISGQETVIRASLLKEALTETNKEQVIEAWIRHIQVSEQKQDGKLIRLAKNTMRDWLDLHFRQGDTLYWFEEPGEGGLHPKREGLVLLRGMRLVSIYNTNPS